jgi:hypothetical protein
MHKSILLTLSLIFSLALQSFSQGQPKPKYVKEVQSIDGILAEVLDIVSREKGEKADTAAFRNLFVPWARFSVHTHDDSAAQPVQTATLDEFIEILSDPYYEEGFEEYELNKVVDEYNGIAHAFQVYRVKDTDGVDETGLNSYQLVYYDDRWWIVSTLWTGNSNGVDVPEKYMK